MRLILTQELAVQALLGQRVGWRTFDKCFAGMRCGPILDASFIVFLKDNACVRDVQFNSIIMEDIAEAVSQVSGIRVQRIAVKSHEFAREITEIFQRYMQAHVRRTS